MRLERMVQKTECVYEEEKKAMKNIADYMYFADKRRVTPETITSSCRPDVLLHIYPFPK